jgi:hypothetical protein
MSGQPTDHRKVYAKGFYDGRRCALEALNLEGGLMRPAQQKAKLDGLPASAIKVWEVVPIEEAWSVHQIKAELFKQNGTLPQPKALLWHLRNMVECELVKELSGGRYKRTPCRVDLVEKVEKVAVEQIKPSVKPLSALQKLAELASHLRQIANEAEEIALELEEMKGRDEQDFQKLKQLKDLLKSIGG